jgi:putative NIF3 family GTP cyclohydrolase 1 type 2
MKVADVMASVRNGLAAGSGDAPGEGLLAGNPGDEVRRIAVCQSPSIGVLRAAAAQPGTLVVSREHPFYLHDQSAWSLGVDTDLTKSNDPVVLGKRKIIADSGVAIYRLSSIWDNARPKAQAGALAKAFGWSVGESGSGRKVVCDIAPVALDPLARFIRDRLSAGHVRIMGSSDSVIGRVALMPEFISLSEARELLALTRAVDAIVCGETCEWEAAVYLKDSLSISRSAASVIFAGTQPTQEPGVRAMYEWLQKRLQGVPTTYTDIVRPVRSLEKSA